MGLNGKREEFVILVDSETRGEKKRKDRNWKEWEERARWGGLKDDGKNEEHGWGIK